MAKPSIQSRAGFEGRGSFELIREFEEKRLISDRGDELQADGQAFRSEAAGNGDSGDAREVRGAIEAQEEGAGGMRHTSDGSGILADERGGDGSGWNNECVHIRIFKRMMKCGDEFLARLQGFQIGDGRDLRAHLEA